MTKQANSFRLGFRTISQIRELAARLEMDQTDIVQLAVEYMYLKHRTQWDGTNATWFDPDTIIPEDDKPVLVISGDYRMPAWYDHDANTWMACNQYFEPKDISLLNVSAWAKLPEYNAE